MKIKYQSIDPSVRPEVFFVYGCEGGGETLYRQKNEHGEYFYYTEGSSGGILDEEEDPFIKWNESFEDFAAFWHHFIKEGGWFYLTPIFVHREIRAFVGEQLNHLSSNQEFNENLKDSWRRKTGS